MELILDMIQLNPDNRKSIDTYLQNWCTKVFPETFTEFLFYLNGAFSQIEYSSSDKRIGLIYKYLDVIWNRCFQKPLPKIQIALNPILFESLRIDNFDAYYSKFYPLFISDYFSFKADEGILEIKTFDTENIKKYTK